MMKRNWQASARSQARIAGGLYMVVVAAGAYALVTTSALIVRGDAAATASNIMAAEHLFRLGFAANLVANAAYVGVIALLYGVLKPAGRTLSFAAACFGLVGCAASGASMINTLATLVFLGDATYLGALETNQVQALARVSLRLGGLGNSIGLVFFGVYCVLIGCLVLRSAFLPRLLGAVMIVAGLGWLTGSFAGFLSPPLGSVLSRYLVPMSGLGETAFTLWLLVMGVNAQKWREQTSATFAEVGGR